jgi:hypothetical protein
MTIERDNKFDETINEAFIVGVSDKESKDSNDSIYKSIICKSNFVDENLKAVYCLCGVILVALAVEVGLSIYQLVSLFVRW